MNSHIIEKFISLTISECIIPILFHGTPPKGVHVPPVPFVDLSVVSIVSY